MEGVWPWIAAGLALGAAALTGLLPVAPSWLAVAGIGTVAADLRRLVKPRARTGL